MERREFIVTFALVLAPLAVEAQVAGKVWHIGILRLPSAADPEIEAFTHGLRDLGYIEGQNIVIDRPAAKGEGDLPSVAADLARLKVDVIFSPSTRTTGVARDTITMIPVVFVTFADPVRAGLVKSLARPGHNLTGLTMIAGELAGKRLELLREALPKVKRVSVLWNPSNPDASEQLNESRSAAQSLGIALDAHAVKSPQAIESAFAAIARAHADALFILSDTMFFRERQRIAGLAERNRLPAMYHWRAYVDAGGLMSYGPNLTDLHRRAATFVDKILKGTKPADLPVEQPTKFELVINLKTAEVLGLTIPPSLLLRADEVIE
jgi:putative ABC transport system substrate-binding protein